MNISTTLVALLGIIISVLLLRRRGKPKKWPIIALIIFISLLVSSFSNSSKTQKDLAPSTSNKTIATIDKVSVKNSSKETETPYQAITGAPTPNDIPQSTEKDIPTEAITTIKTASTTVKPETQSILETDALPLKQAIEVEPNYFTLSWNDPGNYGEEITLNRGTDTATTFIAFRIPAGIYNVKNISERGASQVTVYSGIIKKGQNEELSSEDCPFPLVLMAGKEPQELEIKEGQFVKLSDNSSNIEFVLQE